MSGDSFISLTKPEHFAASEVDVHWNPETRQHVAYLGNDIRLHLATAAAQALSAGLATSLDAERLSEAASR